MIRYKKTTILILLALGLFSFNTSLNKIMHGKSNVALAQQINQSSTSTASNGPNSEFESRKEALSDALNASHDELNELKDEINAERVDSDAWQKIKVELLNQADKLQAYYDEIGGKLNDKNIDSESIKSLANELKSWREKTFREYLKKSINFILIFEEANLLKIADSRSDKISSDISRLEKQSISKSKSLKPLFDQAQTHLKLAHDLNDGAKKLLYNYFELSSQQAADTKTSKGETELQTELPEIIQTEKKPTDPQEIIRDMSQKSLEELKTAYTIFVKMSKAL